MRFNGGNELVWFNQRLLICAVGMIAADLFVVIGIRQQVRKQALRQKLEEEEMMLSMRQEANREMEKQEKELAELRAHYKEELQSLLNLARENPARAKDEAAAFQDQPLKPDGIEPVHLCSAFSNLLDNAIYSC